MIIAQIFIYLKVRILNIIHFHISPIRLLDIAQDSKYAIRYKKLPNHLKGIHRYCNICGFRFSMFLPFNNRKEASCPLCKSRERHRHLYIHLLSLVPYLDGKKILHFGPEVSIKSFFKNINVHYFDADINKSRATYVQDITEMNFEDSFFDYFIAIHVLEHIDDDIKAFNEIYRILKQEGKAFLSVPIRSTLIEDKTITSPEDRRKKFGQHDHVRYYDEKTFLSRLEQAGFSVALSKPQLFPKELVEACRLGDTIFIASKQLK